MNLRASLILCLLVGCPKRPAEVDWTAPPHLPSPTSGTYARVSQAPSDPGVASVLGDRPTDASLSGAAAGLALAAVEANGGLTRWELREALWRAGYPYPVDTAHGWSAPPQSPPPDSIHEWAAGIGNQDVGLVRARGPTGDAWVGLLAAPRVEIGTQPRSVALGGTVQFPAVPGAVIDVVDGDGKRDSASMDRATTFTLATPGEWLFRVKDERGTAAFFPVYAGVDPPQTSLFPIAKAAPATSEEAERRAAEILGIARSAYGVPPYREDPLLGTAARKALSGGTADTGWLDFAVVDRWECSATTVEDCLDTIVWEPEHRAALLGADFERIGMAADLGSQTVRFTVLVAGDGPPR